MNIEKEYRFRVSEENLDLIRKVSIVTKPSQSMTDLVMGYYGFESLSKLGYICRIRNKNNKTVLECKKRQENGSWLEAVVKLDTISQGFEFLSNMGLKPYLLIERTREERETQCFKIAIDNVSLLGQFVEVELKNPENFNETELLDFLDKCKIINDPQPLYGDIFKDKCENDCRFYELFEKRLKEITETIN